MAAVFIVWRSSHPGAALLPPTGNSLAIRPEVVNGNVISGIRGSATSFLMDGVDVSEQHQGGTFIQTSIDALQEFCVQQSPYSAEYNRGGAFFNATTKSGTNRYHGVLFEFLRNDALDARNYFALTRQKLKRNQFGGNIGGPLSIPQSLQWQGPHLFLLQLRGAAPAHRSGEQHHCAIQREACRRLFGAAAIAAVSTTATMSEWRSAALSWEHHSASRLSRLRHWPSCSIFRSRTPRPEPLRSVPSQAIDWNQYVVRFDHQINSSNRLFARWVYITQKEVDPNAAPAFGNAADLTSWGQDIAVGVIIQRRRQDGQRSARALPSQPCASAGLPARDRLEREAWRRPASATCSRPGVGGVFPDYAWSGYTSIQGSGFDQRPKSQDRKAFEGTDNFTILTGRQAIKFGVLFRYYQWLGFDSGNYGGGFTFNGNATGNNTASGDAYADFLLGYPSAVARSYPAANFGGQGLYKQFFVQDDFRVNSRLTLNIGLRYEYSPWLDGYKGQVGTFDPTQAKPIIVSGTGTVPDLTAQPAAPVRLPVLRAIHSNQQPGRAAAEHHLH